MNDLKCPYCRKSLQQDEPLCYDTVDYYCNCSGTYVEFRVNEYDEKEILYYQFPLLINNSKYQLLSSKHINCTRIINIDNIRKHNETVIKTFIPIYIINNCPDILKLRDQLSNLLLFI